MTKEQQENLTQRLVGEGLTGPGLSAWLGMEPQWVEFMRDSGELFAVTPPNGREAFYPAWQFDRSGTPFPVVGKVVRAVRAYRLDPFSVYALLVRRSGLTGARRLLDELRDGREDVVLRAIAAAG